MECLTCQNKKQERHRADDKNYCTCCGRVLIEKEIDEKFCEECGRRIVRIVKTCPKSFLYGSFFSRTFGVIFDGKHHDSWTVRFRTVGKD